MSATSSSAAATLGRLLGEPKLEALSGCCGTVSNGDTVDYYQR
ncbi:hypothetical protein ADILRU_1055 [Leifsonia rubra CMS 76R]|nr:hypothetical protein ADILRU_1055 [Leifsonia rubra CMS 76R]